MCFKIFVDTMSLRVNCETNSDRFLSRLVKKIRIKIGGSVLSPRDVIMS